MEEQMIKAHSDRNRRAQIRATVRCRWPLGIATQAGHFSRQALGGPWPILCWLIEHPEGHFIVDTGDTARNSVPGYLPRWNRFSRKKSTSK
jgi:hypothetical protein